MTTLAPEPQANHYKTDDPVARVFAALTGRTEQSAHTWLGRGLNQEVATALRAHRLANAWARRESWALDIVAELHQLPDRRLDDELLLDHLAADQNDDNWRVNYLQYRTTEARRQWCRALARFHALNLSMMVALKKDEP